MKVLIVGGGSIGERHLRCFQHVMDGEVVLCESMDSRREEVSARYGLTQSHASVEEATQFHWDAAVICTPAHLHVDHALTLLPVASSLMIEKPLSTRLEDALKLQATLEGKIANVAYVNRASPAVEAVRQRLQAGDLGPLHEVTVVSGQHFPTYRPAYREIYYRDRRTGGGAIQDAATHSFNLVHYLAGRFDWVFCDYDHRALEGVEVEDVVHLVGRCNSGQVMVSVSLNQFMAPNESRICFHCQRGSLQLQMPEHRWGVYRHGDDAWTWSETPAFERDSLFRLQAQLFLEAAKGDRPVLCTIEDALHTLKVNLAALKSEGRHRVEID
jgi:predicted dehydrogenase